jgi:hypothetical protein
VPARVKDAGEVFGESSWLYAAGRSQREVHVDAGEAAIIANALMGGLEDGGRGFDALFVMRQAEAIVKALKIAGYEIKRA